MDGAEKSNDIGVEIFCGRQYFTFTAKTWPGAPADVLPISDDALERLRAVYPAKFEQIVVDLLIAMGFGGGDPEMARRFCSRVRPELTIGALTFPGATAISQPTLVAAMRSTDKVNRVGGVFDARLAPPLVDLAAPAVVTPLIREQRRSGW